MGSVTQLVVPEKRFLALLDEAPAVERALLSFTVRRLLAMNSVRTDVHLTAQVRLCRQLIRYSQKPYGQLQPNGTVEIIRMSQASLAGSIGASVAAVEKAIVPYAVTASLPLPTGGSP
jgi:CRP-like cAMP-binding protein